jgi:hypothetical protein
MSKAEKELKGPEFPIDKSDIEWRPEDVTMKRDRFEALLAYVENVSKRLVDAEDELSFERYDTRKAKKEADVFSALSESLMETEEGIQQWLADPENSIQELSRRTKIPYATCHRIVTERLPHSRVETGQLKKIAKAIRDEPVKLKTRSQAEQRTRDVFEPVLGRELSWRLLPKTAKIAAMNVEGHDLTRRVKELAPNDVVIVDVTSSKLSGETLEALGEFAKSGITVVFAGGGRKKKMQRAENIIAVGDVADADASKERS